MRSRRTTMPSQNAIAARRVRHPRPSDPRAAQFIGAVAGGVRRCGRSGLACWWSARRLQSPPGGRSVEVIGWSVVSDCRVRGVGEARPRTAGPPWRTSCRRTRRPDVAMRHVLSFVADRWLALHEDAKAHATSLKAFTAAAAPGSSRRRPWLRHRGADADHRR